VKAGAARFGLKRRRRGATLRGGVGRANPPNVPTDRTYGGCAVKSAATMIFGSRGAALGRCGGPTQVVGGERPRAPTLLIALARQGEVVLTGGGAARLGLRGVN
jgi:hypothetical protein